MTEAEVARELQRFGLLQNEAEVYIFLLKAGACSAGVIARKQGTNRMNIYRALKALEEKGLVESTMGRPTRFVALKVIDFFNRCIETSKTRTSSLEEGRDKIVDSCERLQKTEAPSEEPRFRIIQGRRHIHDQILKMLEKARTEAFVIQSRGGLYRFIYSGIDDRLKELHEKGVDVRILTQVDDAGVEAIRNYLGFAQVRHTDLPSSMRLLIVDEAEALSTFARDDSMSLTTQKELAMWIRAPDYVRSMKLFFGTLWKGGILAQRRLMSIAKKQTLAETLDSTSRALNANGWAVKTPGELPAESGVVHSFDLVATHPRNRNASVVIDALSEHESPHILALNLKSLDVHPALHLLLTLEPPNDEEKQLAARSGIKILHSSRSQQLVNNILEELDMIGRSKTASPQRARP